VGDLVGRFVLGFSVGDAEGLVGKSDGVIVAASEGISEGSIVNLADGKNDGLADDGSADGVIDKTAGGSSDGLMEGSLELITSITSIVALVTFVEFRSDI